MLRASCRGRSDGTRRPAAARGLAQLSADKRDALRRERFAYVDSQGEHLPIHDAVHVRNAISRWNQTAGAARGAGEQGRATERRRMTAIRPSMEMWRPLTVILMVAAACSPASNATGGLGGYVNGICEPTTRTDAAGVVTTTGAFGLLAPTIATAADEILVVWRGDPGRSLEIRADRLDPSNTTWVRWGAHGPTDVATPWGKVGYRLGLKPIGDPGCWRLSPAVGPSQDGVVIVIRR